MQKKNFVIVIVIAVALLGLFLYPKLTDPNRAVVAHWKSVGLDCLPSHQRAALHIHPELTITVDGTLEHIPASTGIVSTCMAEVHVHEANNVIHAESVRSGKDFTLGQFLAVYAKPLERPGYALQMTVDGATSDAGEELVLRDKQKIKLEYTTEPVNGTSQ